MCLGVCSTFINSSVFVDYTQNYVHAGLIIEASGHGDMTTTC